MNKYEKIVIGLHIGHDRSSSVVADGKLIGHLSEERIDRIKHSSGINFPLKSMYKLLTYLKINIKEINCFVITYSFVNIDKVIDSLSQELKEAMNNNNIQVIGMSHHLAHAYSSYYTSSFQDATVIVADGAGDIINNDKLEAESIYVANNNNMSLVYQREQDIPSSYAERRTFYYYPYVLNNDHEKQISVSRKYEQITYLLDFKWGQSGKTMGLAPYGKNLNFSKKDYTDEFGISLTIDDIIDNVDDFINKNNISYNEFKSEFAKDLAKTIQDEIEDIMINFINKTYRKYPSNNLCLAGGLFLNCVMNHKILQQTPYKNIHIVPASGDDGQSIGAAFYGYKKLFGSINNKKQVSPFLGISYRDEEIIEVLENTNYKYKKLSNEKLIEEIVNLINKGFVGGFLRGRSEMGPRALGHRSILANPTLSHMRDHLNRYVKHREVFRPFAPITTEDEQFKYFELEANSPYMLFTASVKKDYKEKLPGIAHVDGTARIEAISKDEDQFLFELLKKFKNVSGFPILLNTSFNLAGEPIVESPKDAIKTFHCSNIDFLILENYIIKKDYCEEIYNEDK